MVVDCGGSRSIVASPDAVAVDSPNVWDETVSHSDRLAEVTRPLSDMIHKGALGVCAATAAGFGRASAKSARGGAMPAPA